MFSEIEKLIKVLLYIMAAIFLGALTVLVFYTVILRFVFHSGFPAGEELCRYLFVYTAFLGVIAGVYANSHMSLDFLAEKVPKLRGPVKVIIYICHFVFFGIMAYYGTIFAEQAATAKSTLLPITMNYIYAAVPVCGYTCLFIVALRVAEDISRAHGHKEEQA